MAAGDLTTLTNLKDYMQLPVNDTSNDTTLSRLITAISAWFLTQTNRDTILSQSFTENRNGTGGNIINPFNWPLSAVASVTVDGVSIPQSINGAPGFAFDDYSIYLVGQSRGYFRDCMYRFNRGFGNVQLVYTAGYASTPGDVEQAVLDQVVFTFRRQPNMGTVSQSANGILTTTFSQKDIAPGVQQVVDYYKDRTVVGI